MLQEGPPHNGHCLGKPEPTAEFNNMALLAWHFQQHGTFTLEFLLNEN